MRGERSAHRAMIALVNASVDLACDEGWLTGDAATLAGLSDTALQAAFRPPPPEMDAAAVLARRQTALPFFKDQSTRYFVIPK